MIRFDSTGKVYKNDKGEHCLNTEYTVTLTLTEVNYNNVDEKVAEFIKSAYEVKQILENTLIKT